MPAPQSTPAVRIPLRRRPFPGETARRVKGTLVSMAVHGLLIAAALLLYTGRPTNPPPTDVVFRHVEEPALDNSIVDPPQIPNSTPVDDPGTLGMQDVEIDIPMPSPEPLPEARALNTFSPVTLDIPAGGWTSFTEGITTVGGPAGPRPTQSTPLGAGQAYSGDLVGTLYDLKRDADGKNRQVDYTRDLRDLARNGFRQRDLDAFFTVPKRLYLSHLYMPNQPAEAGPKAFGAEDHMKPRKWIVKYTGQIQAPVDGRYRFVGEFDDILIVMIDGDVVFEAEWTGNVTGWTPEEYVGAHRSFTGHPLVYGDWVRMKAGQPRRIDILLGEDPGGKVGGLLMLEQKGRRYQTGKGGRPLLPVFTVQPLTPGERDRLAGAENWEFEMNQIPVMGVPPETTGSQAPVRENDPVTFRIR